MEVTPAVLRGCPLPVPDGESDKDARGAVLVISGSLEAPGGAILAGLAALRAGAGKLKLASPAVLAQALAIALPEALVVPVEATDAGAVSLSGVEQLGRIPRPPGAVVVGPGMIDLESSGALAAGLLAQWPDAAFVIDAAAMTGLKNIPGAASLCAGRAVLTPHRNEMARLMDTEVTEIEASPERFAPAAAERWNAVVVLKGAVTHIASPGGALWRHVGGAQGLGTSGSGDVLAGLIGGLLARGAAPDCAALWGVSAHAHAGRRLSSRFAPTGYLAREILTELPASLFELAMD